MLHENPFVPRGKLYKKRKYPEIALKDLRTKAKKSMIGVARRK
jgi:hypothetical protein